jgi:GntR family transcriptional regulator/MocR family aminotransferase
MPALRIGGVAAGLHLMLDLPAGIDERAVIAEADAQSIRVFGAARYRARSRDGPPALVLGYGCVSDSLIRDGIEQLARVIERHSR